jgi:hypothetical protein
LVRVSRGNSGIAGEAARVGRHSETMTRQVFVDLSGFDP